MKLLLVEDESKLSRSLRAALGREGYSVDVALDGEMALDYAEVYEYDLILLDVMLPKLDGFEVLRRLRSKRFAAPVLMLTAREDTRSKVRGLDIGADDYVAKPFELEELFARIRALLRRRGPDRSGLLHIHDLVMDPASKRVSRGGRALSLTAREYQLLEFLLRNKNRILSREVIYEHVWSGDFSGTRKIVDVYVKYLRSKIDQGFEPRLLQTVRGLGYVLSEERYGA
ncbi:MAG TPA: response regulator transcription factor [Vicinamibacteria bacterium]|nr:response regulator transcription factor [Vicinamibacteria bacterium]